MNNFPFPWWDKTITVYNKSIDPTTQRVSWYSTTVENCFWKYVNGTRVIKAQNLVLDIKEIICRIPENENFLKKYDWDKLADKTGKFTLDTGDIIVLGEVEDVIDEYTSGKRSTDIIAKYKKSGECLEVETYVNNVQSGIGLAHYRVVGK